MLKPYSPIPKLSQLVDRYDNGWEGLLNIHGYIIPKEFCRRLYLNFLSKRMLKNIWPGYCSQWILINRCTLNAYYNIHTVVKIKTVLHWNWVHLVLVFQKNKSNTVWLLEAVCTIRGMHVRGVWTHVCC